MSPTPSLRRSLASQVVSGSLTVDGESGVRITGFPPQSSTLRRSVSEYYETAGYSNSSNSSSTDDAEDHTASSSRAVAAAAAAAAAAASSSSASAPASPHPITATPPTYDETVHGGKPLPPSRFRISPREEEGNEQLPGYTCTLHKEALFEMKMEMSSPFERAPKRRWGKTYAVLYGTLLQLHKPRRVPFFSGLKKSRVQAGRPPGHLPGEMLKSYTLQLAEVGIAADYRKRHFVIRIRAQTEQFLLSCRTLETFLEWLEALSAAVDLSPSLEERSLPRYQTLPRRRRRRRSPRAEQDAITRREGDSAPAPAPAPVPSSGRRTPSPTRPEADRMTPSPPPLPRTSRPRPRPRRPVPDIDESDVAPDGKWAPAQHITAEANMRYARRCMAVLVGDAPRQSDFVIKDGKRYKLIYEKKELEPVVEAAVGAGAAILPPAYEELRIAIKNGVIGKLLREVEDADGEGDGEEEDDDPRPAIVV